MLEILTFISKKAPTETAIYWREQLRVYNSTCTDSLRSAIANTSNSITRIKIKIKYVYNKYKLQQVIENINNFFPVKVKVINSEELYYTLEKNRYGNKSLTETKDKKDNSLKLYTVTCELELPSSRKHLEVAVSMVHHILRAFSLANNLFSITKTYYNVVNYNINNYYNNISLSQLEILAHLINDDLDVNLNEIKPSKLSLILKIYDFRKYRSSLPLIIRAWKNNIKYKEHWYRLYLYERHIELVSPNNGDVMLFNYSHKQLGDLIEILKNSTIHS